VARFALLMFVLLASTNPSSAADSDDVSRARELVREARDLCGSNCDNDAVFAAAEAKTGDVALSKQSFLAAWNAAGKLEDGVRRMVLNGIAELQAQAGQSKEAIEASQRLPSRYEQAMTLGTIAIAQAETGEEKEALQTVDLIPAEEIWQRNSTLPLVAMSLSKRGNFAGAIRVLNHIPVDVKRAAKILARNIPREQLKPEDQSIVDAATAGSNGLVVIAEDQAKASDLKSALQTAQGIGTDSHRDAALRRVACVAADSGDLAVAQAALKGISGQEQKGMASVRIVAAMAKQGQFKEALALAETIKDPSARADALFEMAAAQAARGDAKAATRLFDRATSLNPSDSDAHHAAQARIVRAFLQRPDLELAEAFTSRIDDPATLSEAFQDIAAADWRMKKTVDAKRFSEKSQQAAESIAEPYMKCIRLRKLAVAEFEVGDQENASTAIQLAVAAGRKIEIGGGTDVIALTETATTQRTIGDRDGAAATFEIAIATANRYPEESYVAELLKGVAAAQADAGDVEAAIQSARRQDSALYRSSMLLGVANAILSRQETTP
jgi:tetratricopeptide (TPR) repeat protein